MLEEKISIVMPAYNAEDTICKTIESIVSQTYTNWELLIIDDGSIDKTKEKIQTIKDARVRYLYQKNSGPAAARNMGLKEAKGKYITFVDSDDIIHSNYLETLYEILKEKNVDIAMCSYIKLEQNQLDNIDEYNIDLQNKKIGVLSSDECIKRMFYKKQVMPYPFLKLMKREIIGDIKFPEELRLGEDLEFNLNVLKHCSRIAITDQIMYFHIENHKSITHNLNLKTAESHFNQLKKMYENERQEYCKAIENRIFVVAYDFLCQMHGETNGWELKNKCKEFIRKHKTNVLKDSETSKLVKILALMSHVSIQATTVLCRFGKRMKSKKAL